MRSVIVLLALLALVGASAAVAARGDPEKRIAPADQARARSMLLRRSDFAPAVRAVPGSEAAHYCAALDESDLTLTGEAQSPDFITSLQDFGSSSEVYASTSDASTSWRRGTSSAGVACAAAGYRWLSRKQGVEFVSYRRASFPSVAPRTAAYRWIWVTGGTRFVVDLVFMMRGRAQAGVFFLTPAASVEQAQEVGYARLVAGRMATAMRGS
jgi:hypothetical protein